jgi:hypothetical protein
MISNEVRAYRLSKETIKGFYEHVSFDGNEMRVGWDMLTTSPGRHESSNMCNLRAETSENNPKLREVVLQQLTASFYPPASWP